jgi:hypothetical protein
MITLRQNRVYQNLTNVASADEPDLLTAGNGANNMQSFLYYWKPQTVDEERDRGELLNHSASEQFDRVQVGDHVWHATVRDGELSIIGRIIVGHVVDQEGAARLLGKKSDELWARPHHIVAETNTAEPIREVRIPQLSASLRFEGPHDRLAVDNGKVSVFQLRAMRTLTLGSAAELERAYVRTA